MNKIQQLYHCLGILEGSADLYESCDQDTLASMSAADRDRLQRGRLLEFLVHGSAESSRTLLQLASSWMQTRAAIFAAQHPEEAAEYEDVMATMREGSEL